MLSIKERNPNTIQNPEADTKILFNDATDGKLKTKDSTGTIEEVALVDENAPKVYVALLTQTGTNAPVATVLQNTLGGVPVWSYADVGKYIGTLSGAFVGNTNIDQANIIFYRTINIDATGAPSRGFFILKNDDNTVYLRSISDIETYVDDGLTNTYIKIEVYP